MYLTEDEKKVLYKWMKDITQRWYDEGKIRGAIWNSYDKRQMTGNIEEDLKTVIENLG